MPFKSFTFDDSAEEVGSAGVDHINKGEYLLEVTGLRCSPNTDEYHGESIFYWDLKVVDGPDTPGKRISHSTPVTSSKPGAERVQWGLAGTISACLGQPMKLSGKPVSDYRTFLAYAKAIEAQCKGTRIYAIVDDRAGSNGRMYSNPVKVGPASEFVSRPGGYAPTAPAANGGGAPAEELDAATQAEINAMLKSLS